MELLIVAATKLEIAPSLPFLKRAGAQVLISGVGIASSIYSITKAIQQYRPQLMIQAGIGGGFDKKVTIGEVMAISEEQFADIGVYEQGQWRNIFDLGFADPNKRPFKQGLLKNPNRKILGKTGLKVVPGATINEISTNKARISLLKAKGVVVESMEGAAFHYVALMEKVAFLQIRAISNYVGERDKSKWKLKDSIANLNSELIQLVGQVAR